MLQAFSPLLSQFEVGLSIEKPRSVERAFRKVADHFPQDSSVLEIDFPFAHCFISDDPFDAFSASSDRNLLDEVPDDIVN